MDVFDLDCALLADYARFARSFTQIRAPDIRWQVEEIYASNRFWPEPLISINPHFERGASLTELVADGSLHPETASVFRVEGEPITLYSPSRFARRVAWIIGTFVPTLNFRCNAAYDCHFAAMRASEDIDASDVLEVGQEATPAWLRLGKGACCCNSDAKNRSNKDAVHFTRHAHD